MWRMFCPPGIGVPVLQPTSLDSISSLTIPVDNLFKLRKSQPNKSVQQIRVCMSNYTQHWHFTWIVCLSNYGWETISPRKKPTCLVATSFSFECCVVCMSCVLKLVEILFNLRALRRRLYIKIWRTNLKHCTADPHPPPLLAPCTIYLNAR